MAIDGIPYLYRGSSISESYRVLGASGELTIDEHFSGKNAKSRAIQAAKLFKTQVDNLTKGFLTRAELAEKLGFSASSIDGK